MDIVRLSVPGLLRYRDVVLRAVSTSCRLVRAMAESRQEASRSSHDFDDKVVSAVGEAFNNVAIHAYRDLDVGTVDVELELSGDGITVRLRDTGRGFDPRVEAQHGPEPLPESHMGLYIMRECMDHVAYRRRGPGEASNQLTLTKRFVHD